MAVKKSILPKYDFAFNPPLCCKRCRRERISERIPSLRAGGIADAVCTYDATDTLPQNEFQRRGKAFLGWSTKKNGKPVYADGAEVRNLANTQGKIVTLYAVWGTVQ